MVARVQIVVEAKDASSGVLRAITGQMGALGGLVEELTAKNVNWGSISERAATMVVDALRNAINNTIEYAQEVRDLSLASGQGAEASSRFLQVLDDYQLTAEDAKTATKALTREGLAPTVETLAQISEEYNRLSSAEERNALVQKKLGRAGQEWLNLLAQGPDKIRAMNDAVSEALILSEKDIRAIEQYRLSLDQLSDTWQGLEITVGTGVIPVLNDLLTVVNDNVEAGKGWLLAMQYMSAITGNIPGLYTQLTAAHKNNTAALNEEKVAMEGVTESMKAQEEEAKRLEEETKRTSEYYQGLIGDIQNAQAEIDRYTETTADLTAQKSKLNAEIETLTRRYGANSQQVQEAKASLMELDEELAENEKRHQKWAAQTVYSFALARAAADGVSKEEGEVLIQLGEQLGLFDAKTAETMRAVNDAFDSLDVSDAQATIKTVETQLNRLTGKTWVIKITTDTSGVNLPSNNAGMPDYYQSGGQVYAGRPITVGEGGAEPFIPSVNGRILGHAESLHALSMGGGGNNMYFYGNVSISPDSQGGGDLLNIR